LPEYVKFTTIAEKSMGQWGKLKRIIPDFCKHFRTRNEIGENQDILLTNNSNKT